MTVNIFEEFTKAKNRTGWSNNLLARSLHITAGAISNWESRGTIPDDKLRMLAKALDDYDFSAACAEYSFGIRVHSEARVQDTPQAKYFQQVKEENDRLKLDHGFTVLLGKLKGDRTDEDRHKVLEYCRELSEEIESENSYLAAIMNDWGLEVAEVE